MNNLLTLLTKNLLRVGRKVETKDISDSFYKPFEMYDPDKLDQAHFILHHKAQL